MTAAAAVASAVREAGVGIAAARTTTTITSFGT
jgi:hypothetical protein